MQFGNGIWNLSLLEQRLAQSQMSPREIRGCRDYFAQLFDLLVRAMGGACAICRRQVELRFRQAGSQRDGFFQFWNGLFGVRRNESGPQIGVSVGIVWAYPDGVPESAKCAFVVTG